MAAISSLSPRTREIYGLQQELDQARNETSSFSNRFQDSFKSILEEKTKSGKIISPSELRQLNAIQVQMMSAARIANQKEKEIEQKSLQFIRQNGNIENLAKALYSDPKAQRDFKDKINTLNETPSDSTRSKTTVVYDKFGLSVSISRENCS